MSKVMVKDKEVLIEDFLTPLVGNKKWAKYFNLESAPREIIFKRAQNLTRIFGERWKEYPCLLRSRISTINTLVDEHNHIFGSDEWMLNPTLAAITSRTFDSSFRALELMGMSYEKHKKTFLMTLSTTMENKRKKAKIIRKELLGHENIHICGDGVVLLSQCVKYRANLTWEQKQNEKKEIREFIRFLEEFPRLLSKSEKTIREWGAEKSYHNDCGKKVSPATKTSAADFADDEENIDTMRFAN